MISAIVLAAGSGKRMGGKTMKQFLKIGSNPVIIQTLSVFERSCFIDDVILVSPESEVDFSRRFVKAASLDKVSKIVVGGSERQHSVKNGLNAVSQNSDIVIIHDGVRPFLTEKNITDVVASAKKSGAAILAVPVKDTVKEASGEYISRTIPRENLWLAQTPQAFRYNVIKKAFENADNLGLTGTDDASLVEATGKEVSIVLGSYNNIKITTPEDLLFAEALVSRQFTVDTT